MEWHENDGPNRRGRKMQDQVDLIFFNFLDIANSRGAIW